MKRIVCRRFFGVIEQMVLVVQNVPANAGDVRSLISGWGRSPGGGNGNPLQHSFLESPINPGAWQPTVHRVAQRQTWLNAQRPIFCLDNSYATVYIGQNFLNCVLKECELIVCNYLSKIRVYFSDVKIHFFFITPI